VLRAREPEHPKLEQPPQEPKVEALERRRAEVELAAEVQRLRPQKEPKI
jgi:hypothetical protein